METSKVPKEKHPSPFDVTLKVADTKIGAHRDVLSGGSEYFRSLLVGSFKEASDSEIDLTKVTTNSTVLEKVVDFMYTKEIDLNDNSVSEIVKLASYFCIENLQKLCEDYLLDRMNKDTCLNYYLLAVDHGLKTIDEKSGIVLESRIHDYLITKDIMITLLPPQLKMIASKGFFKYCSLPSVVCFLSKWIEQGQSDQHVSVASEMLQNLVTDSDSIGNYDNNMYVDCKSAIMTLEACNLKPELCRKIEEIVKQNAGPLPQGLEDVVLTISPRKNVVDKCVEALKTRNSSSKLSEKFTEDILDLCLYVPARKQWYHLKSLEDDGINAKILRGLHDEYASGELYLGRFTLLKNYLFIGIQNSDDPIHAIDLRDFSVRKIPIHHISEKLLEGYAVEDTYGYDTFSDIWLTANEDTLFMIINIMYIDQFWGEVSGYSQLVYKLESDDSWVEVCNTSKNTSNYDDNNVYACINDGEMLLVCRCNEPTYVIIDLKCPDPNFSPEVERSPHVKLQHPDGEHLSCFYDAWRLHFLRNGTNVYVVSEGTRREKEETNLTTYACSDVFKTKSKTFETCSKTEIVFGEKEKKCIEPCEYQMAFNDGKSIWNFTGDPATDRSHMTEVFVGESVGLEKREHTSPPFSSIINGAAGKMDLAELKLTPITEYFY